MLGNKRETASYRWIAVIDSVKHPAGCIYPMETKDLDILDRTALETSEGAMALMSYARSKGWTNQQIFCMCVHLMATLYKMSPAPEPMRQLGVLVSKHIFRLSRGPMAGVEIVRPTDEDQDCD